MIDDNGVIAKAHSVMVGHALTLEDECLPVWRQLGCVHGYFRAVNTLEFFLKAQ